MNHESFLTKHQLEMVGIEKAMVEGKHNLVSGYSLIVYHAGLAEIIDDEILNISRMVESDTLEYPEGEVRNHYSVKGLGEVDREIELYLEDIDGVSLNDCHLHHDWFGKV